jgi:hypothetical protein
LRTTDIAAPNAYLMPLMRPWTTFFPASRSHVPALETAPLIRPGSCLTCETARPGSCWNHLTTAFTVLLAHDTIEWYIEDAVAVVLCHRLVKNAPILPGSCWNHLTTAW